MKVKTTVEYEINLQSQTPEDIIGFLEYEAKMLCERMEHPMMPFKLLNSKIKVEEVK